MPSKHITRISEPHRLFITRIFTQKCTNEVESPSRRYNLSMFDFPNVFLILCRLQYALNEGVRIDEVVYDVRVRIHTAEYQQLFVHTVLILYNCPSFCVPGNQ